MTDAILFPLPGEEDWRLLLKAAQRSPTPWRDRVILGLLWECAVRPDELVALRLSDLHLPTGRLHLPTRDILVPENVLAPIMTYLALERPSQCPGLLAGPRGRSLRSSDLSRLFLQLAQASGCDVSPWALHLAGLRRQLPRVLVTALAPSIAER